MQLPALRLYLDAILPTMEEGEMIEARYLLPGQPPERRFYPGRLFLFQDVARTWRDLRHCYIGVALRRGRGGTAADISRAWCCWADIDHKLWSDAPDQGAVALQTVTSFMLRPSLVVATGGGLHPYWRLRRPYSVSGSGRERLERINGALARALCGQGRHPDHVQDVARILRMPDTLNWKYTPALAARLLWSEPDRTYRLDDIEDALGVCFPWAIRPVQETRAAPHQQWRAAGDRPSDLRERAAAGRIRRATLDLLDLPGAAGYPSASEADAALATGLIGAGLTPGEVYTVILSSPRGHDLLLRKGERHGESVLRRTVHRAAEFAGPGAQALRFLRGA